MTEGWMCPGCKRCYSPLMTMCNFCVPAPITTGGANDSTGTITVPGEPRYQVIQ